MISTICKMIFCMAGLIVIMASLMQEGKSQNGFTGTSSTTDSYWNQNKKNSIEGKWDVLIKSVAYTFVISAFILMVI